MLIYLKFDYYVFRQVFTFIYLIQCTFKLNEKWIDLFSILTTNVRVLDLVN